MRRYSFFTIVLLCVGILLLDIWAFYWLRSITQLITATWIKLLIDLAFWLFTLGLISAILILKVRLDNIAAVRRHVFISSLFGLTVLSFVPKLIFVVIITILHSINYVFSEEESLVMISVVGLFSGFLPFFVILYGIFWSLYRFQVHRISLASDKIPENFKGMRIVQISDAHLGSFNFRYEKLRPAIKIINRLNPDLIFFTGDLVNNFSWELRGWEDTMAGLHAKKGKYAVLGNHDYGDYSEWESKAAKRENFQAIQSFYQSIGFRLLQNEAEIISMGGEELALVGVENWGNPPFKQYGDLSKALAGSADVPFKILLSHDPSHWNEVIRDTDIVLTLSGHTHGMQAAFGPKNRKWSPIKYKYKRWAGLYREGGQYLYVNRGLGWLGFPGRLGMRPEITCIDL